MVLRSFFLLFCLILAGCKNPDQVDHYYATRKEAETDHLFGKGWLPEIIPQSSVRITTRNNLDWDISDGEFYFMAGERTSFIGKLQPYANVREPFQNFEAEVTEKRKRGYEPYSYTKDGERWIFFVNHNTGHASYYLLYAEH